MSTFLNFIINQLVNTEYSLKLDSDIFSINTSIASYSEPFFDDNVTFTKEEIDNLKIIVGQIKANENEQIDFSPIPLVKSWYLITHEKYFKKDIALDKYGRVGQENLLQEFQEILSIPIADILRNELRRKLCVIKTKSTPTIYLTSDFDILNIWDVWGFKDFVREVTLSLVKLQFLKSYEVITSYFFSRYFSRFNGYLNDLMYVYNSDFINVAFFISTPKNQKYDGTISYFDSPVKKYLKKLRMGDVLFGLHTNFETHNYPETINEQQIDFEKLFGNKASINRHHYLRFHFPEYLNTLEQGGITEDFSVYFPESMLFRCGTSSSFVPWNKNKNRPYLINVLPTTIMDGTFSDYMFVNYEDALALSKEKIDLCFKYSDNIVLLWHNRSTYRYSNIDDNYHPKLIQNIINYLKDKTT